MKLCVLGLWHLGSVTTACCARHFQVTGLDQDAATIANLNQGRAPLFEPGLNELISAGLAAGKLTFTTNPKAACAGVDILWLTIDTPVDENDESDVNGVLAQLRQAAPHLPAGALVLISAQLPVGTCAGLEKEYPALHFACSPENLRLGRAIDAFEKAERAVVGIRSDAKKELLAKLFAPFAQQVLFMRTESAEMVKHALNSFLALSITFINEIARLCEHTGADAREVSAGLKSEARIGPRAYLLPGVPFAGGTLARDVVTLTKLAGRYGEKVSVIPAIKQSNDLHRGWAARRLQMRLGDLHGKKIAVLGLAYTPNTDTLRRSAAVELCQQLLAAGAKVTAYDPAIKNLPPELRDISVAPDIAAALTGADAAAVCTGWPEFRSADWARLIPQMCQPVIVDAGAFLEKELKTIPELSIFSSVAPEMKLQNHNTLITGGSQGFGKVIAEQFLLAGANVVFCARNEKELAATRDELAKKFPAQKILARACDVANETQVNDLIAFALRELGPLQSVVLNAGIYGPKGPTESVSLEEWRRALDINLFSVLLPSRAIIPHFKKARRGKIVVISGGGATNPMPNISAYAASKAAVVRLMETLAEELKAFGVDVNAIAPGALATRLLDEILAAGPEKVGAAFYEKNKKWKETGAVPKELGAGLAVYLASAESNGITGKLISAQWDPWKDLQTHREDLAKSDIYCLRRIVPEDRGKKWSDK